MMIANGRRPNLPVRACHVKKLFNVDWPLKDMKNHEIKLNDKVIESHFMWKEK